MSDTLSIAKIADLSGISHATARRRLTAGGAISENDGRYTLPSVLRAFEKLASGRQGELDATAAKTRLANLRIEKESIEFRKIKGELVEVEPWLQYMKALSKCLWSALQSLRLDRDDLERVHHELNRVTAEFVRQNAGPQILTLQEAEEFKEMEAKRGQSE